MPLKWINKKENTKEYILEIKGLKGGHSGAEIHLERGNANKLLGRVLNALNNSLKLQLSSISGGSKDNAIPREADAKFIINNFTKAKEIISEYEGIFKNELRVSDKDIRLEVEEIEINELFGQDESSKIIEAISLHTNGIKSMSLDIEGLVESSLNLGVIVTNENSVTLHSAIRSSVLSQKIAMIEELKILAKVMNINFTDSAHYPAWQYREQSKIRDIFEKTYEKINNKKPKIKAIHAGLECGLFDEKFNDIDMISFGPDIRNAHTPEEMVSIASIERVWKYFVEVMKATKENY